MKLHIIIIALIMSALSASAAEPDYYDLMGEADKSIKDGKWDDAETALRSALRLEPANPLNVLLMSNLGMVQFYAGRLNEALSTLTSAHEAAPASVTVLQNRAKVYASVGQTDKALADYQLVMELDTASVEPLFYSSALLINANRAAEAKELIARMKALDSDAKLTLAAQAMMDIYEGRYNDAIPPLSTILKEDPDEAYYSSRALCYLMTDQIGAAADDIAAGLELDPTDGELYLYRAMLNKMRYRPDDAHADGQLAIKWGVDPARVKAILNE